MLACCGQSRRKWPATPHPNKHVEHQSVSHNACNGITKFTGYSATKHYVGSNTAVNHIMTSTLVNQLAITYTLHLGTALTYTLYITKCIFK